MTSENRTKRSKISRATAENRTRLGITRFRIIFIVACIIGAIVIFAALRTMLHKREYWEVVREQFTKANLPDPAVRGNIYDCKNRLLVGSVPEYRLCMDFKVIDKDERARAKAQAWRDSAFVADLDSIVEGLDSILPGYGKEYFRERLETGFKEKKNGWAFLPRQATFIEYKACMELPLLRETTYKGGFHGEKTMARKKPYGSLASRTLGSLHTVFLDKDGKVIPDSVLADCRKKNIRIKCTSEIRAKNGIELAFDTILHGKDGIKHNTKVRNTRVDFSDQAAVDGHDLMTTIDMTIQDVAEKALVAQLKDLQAEMGIVIVMEAATGDVKAIVNMGRDDSGHYSEMMNYAVSERMEPGSTFKTASLMAALEDGLCDTSTIYHTGNGVHEYYNRNMKDASWSSTGGYGSISVKKIMQKSSNVGISLMVHNNYKDHPDDYVKALEREGAGIPLNLPIPGAQDAYMKKTDDKTWSKTSLPWMSIGYESLLPPISTCTFYNGIANGGKLVKPRFLKAEMKDGKVIREFPVEVLREKMCSDKTLEKVRGVLESVVSAHGATGRRAKCPFKVAGKTGTAQIANARGTYRDSDGGTRYFISFCGFFPFENPKYTCFVGIRKYGLPASGGTHCAPIFAKVAQAVMANGSTNHRVLLESRDSMATKMPMVNNGNTLATGYVLKELGIPHNLPQNTSATNKKNQNETWCVTEKKGDRINLKSIQTEEGKMPNVEGMGARDAVFALKSVGLKVKLRGVGKVYSQSIKAGADIVKNSTVVLALK